MTHKRRALNCAFFIITFLVLSVFTSCREGGAPQGTGNALAFSSFREVPGITYDEIRAIQALQAAGTPLIYAAGRTTELFDRQDGSLGGYTVLLCDWLSDLFGIQFIPEIMNLGAMLENLGTGRINFATLSATPERRLVYYMTDISQRSIIMLRADGSPSMAVIRQERLPRYVFTEGSVMLDMVRAALEPGTYEEIMVPNEDSAYWALVSGTGDAFIVTTNMEAAFDHYGGVHTEDFLPLIFLPAAMTAVKPELNAIISVLTKALESGAYEHLTDMYRQGYRDYRTHKFFLQLNEDEIEYIQNNPVIPFASQFMSYPMSFYNQSTRTWEGAVFDIMDEITLLSGLEFRLTHDHTADLSDLLELLENGTAYFVPNMIQSNERMERFLWANILYQMDSFALLSKRDYPNIELNDIPFERIGYARNSAFADMFRHWFPYAPYAVEYATTDEAFMALDRGEINLVFTNQSRLTALTNYYELSEYKPNFIFNAAFDATFGFNREQVVLRSIVDKALHMIDTERIVQQWSTRTHNLEATRLRAQRPWLISAMVLSLFVLALVLIMFFRIRKETVSLTIANREAETANKAKSAFLANMSHELRTPLNSTINMIRTAIPEQEHEKRFKILQQAMTSSNDLLSVLNTILEISNIESGKLVLSISSFSLNSVLKNIDSLISSLCKAKGVHWDYKAGIPELYVKGDRIRLMQALTILLRNAVKYSSEGNGKVSFNVNLLSSSDDAVSLHFKVSDNGIGMTDKKFSELTQMLAPDNTGIHYSSSEIMLSACNSIVRAMGSHIQVESDSGSHFSFTLDLPKADMPEKTESNDQNKTNFTGKRVLVVDDVAVNRTILKNVLSQEGMVIIEAKDGKEAVDTFQAEGEKINLILMDIMMPNMDGYEAAQAIRASGHANSQTVPIIAVTSLSYHEDINAATAAGMNFHLSKPVEPKTLISTITRYL